MMNNKNDLINGFSLLNNDVWQVRTDLAYDEVIKYHNESLTGVTTEEFKVNDIPVIRNIIDKTAETKLNKKAGLYYTLNLENLDFHDSLLCEKIEHALAKVINEVLEEKELKNKRCLLVGLGNINVTPDALGPYVIDNVIVTRHLEISNTLSDGFASVCAISPGVMGQTGIETFDIIKAVVKDVKVDFLIVVDALASNALSRVNKTIQITDTGISPGSGVGNKRKELTLNTIGIPVVAIGVPTVVDAITITSTSIDYVLNYLSSVNNNKIEDKNNQKDAEEVKKTYFGEVGLLTLEEKKALMQEVLTPMGYNLMVTPKEIDEDIDDLSKIIATGINLSLHEGLFKGVTE